LVQGGQVGDRRRGALAQLRVQGLVDVLGAQAGEHRLAQGAGVRGCSAADAGRHRGAATAGHLVEIDHIGRSQHSEVHDERRIGVQAFQHR
jgi:hypothetical protein